MKYLRSLMQQSVTACKNQAKLIQQFTLSLLYLLIIHIVALCESAVGFLIQKLKINKCK